MEQKIHIKLISRRAELGGAAMRALLPLYDCEPDEASEALMFDDRNRAQEETIEMTTEGVLRTVDGRVEIAYDETELSGMEGAKTVVSFDPNEPELVTMMRGGTVSTVLIFEPHRRHICAYQTPWMPFEICIFAHRVENALLQEGTLELDYIIEVRGAQAERTGFRMEIRSAEEDPIERPEMLG